MNKVKIVTHNGNFHPDDLFAVATLLLVLDLNNDKYEIIRTRDPQKIAEGDYVLDVGGVHDPEKNHFDHHQIGGSGKRLNGIPYATFGLVWKKYGAELCGDEEIAKRVDEKVIQSIDADDSGVSIFTPVFENVKPYQLEMAISSFIPTWREKDQDLDQAFLKSLILVEEVLAREVKRAKDYFEGKKRIIKAYQDAGDKRIIVLDDEYSWGEVLITYPEPLYVVGPRKSENGWGVAAVRKKMYGFENRKDLPKEWAGKKDKELAEITGVSDARFCHNARFLAVASSFEGALALAKLALES